MMVINARIKPLLIGTSNPSKLQESLNVLREEGLKILSLNDFPGIKPVEESGTTFEENAVLKAKGYFSQTGLPCIADDGGLAIEYWGGLPGVHSRRFVGENATDLQLVEEVLRRLEGVPREKRKARLGTLTAFYDGKNLLTRESWVEGYIAERIMTEIRDGFPYRAILIIPQFNKPYGLLTEEEHQQVNFRRKNLRELKPQILKLLT